MDCVRCNERIGDGDPHHNAKCWPCAFITGELTATQYQAYSGCGVGYFIVYEEKIWLKFRKNEAWPWELKNKDIRRRASYRSWRLMVLARDEKTCKDCGAKGKGVELHAHHIKAFAKYPKKRLSIKNGLTLCATCHKAIHRKKVK